MGTKRLKHVVQNPYHLWAHQTYAQHGNDQNHARNSSGNRSFEGTRAFSYAACIAEIHEVKGQQVYLLSSYRWSSITGGHQSEVHSAIPYEAKESGRVFHVRFMSEPDRSWWSNHLNSQRTNAGFHADNVNALIAEFREEAGKAKRARKYKLGHLNSAVQRLDAAQRYAKLFKVKGIRWAKLNAELAELESHREEYQQAYDRAKEREEELARQRHEAWLAAEPERRAAQEERERLAKLREEERRKEAEERLEAWLAGDTSVPTYLMGSLPYPRLRVRGDTVETTQGANVPADHVRRVLPMVLSYLDAGREFVPNGKTIHLGHYAVNSISAEGVVTVGCHRFPAEEVRRFAGVLG